MKRKIIQIDEKKCTGCGLCIPDCPEGALQILDGKARLVSDLFCDGLGACIGTCPEGAIAVIEREAEPYDEKTVMATITEQGPSVIRAHLEHLLGHKEIGLYNQAIDYLNEYHIRIPNHQIEECHPINPFGSCPGSAAQSIPRGASKGGETISKSTDSELRQWPIQLKLLNPEASYFENAHLLISADCAPFAYANFHQEYLRGKIVIIFCPKLDTDIEGYIEKLTEILKKHTINSVTILRMEVPCCGGIRYVLDQAMHKSGKKIPVVEQIVTIQGSIK